VEKRSNPGAREEHGHPSSRLEKGEKGVKEKGNSLTTRTVRTESRND